MTMEQVEQSVLDTIEQYNLIDGNASVLIAVSGGPDSTALLQLLVQLLPEKVKGAAYIDHNLRPAETGAEVAHVKRMCRLSNVRFHYGAVNVPLEKKTTGESTEECARRLRYLALEQIRVNTGADLTAVGHTGDDLVEEVLIRLVRGSGLKGLAGINPSYGRVIRPLINLSKKQVLDYLEHNGLHYCLDSSNRSPVYLRNRIRLELLPLLEEKFNPSIRKTIRRTAAVLADEEAFIAAETERCFQALVSGHVSPVRHETNDLAYSADEFSALHTAIKRRIIEKIFWLSGAEPTFQAIQDTLLLSDHGPNGTELHMNSGLIIRKSAGKVFFSVSPQKKGRYREPDILCETVEIEAPGEYPVGGLQKTLVITKKDACPSDFSSGRLYISLKRNIFPMQLRQPLPGESFTPLGAPGRKKVSRFLSDRKIPRHLRHTFPVLSSGDEIVAIAGIAISDAFKITGGTTECLELSWR